MGRRWTPRRLVALRRIRVMVCVIAMVLASCVTFAVTQRKAVALTVNGETTQVTSYASTVAGLLREQGVGVKTHDVVTSRSSGVLTDHDEVTVQSAYQTTISIDGQEVPFWTVATSAEQLLGFFEQNHVEANRITVDIKNIYNQLTGGMVINEDGPVTVIADGKTSVAPDGKLPAASILDSKSIVLNKDDRVTVSKDGSETILRVQRVTYGEETVTEAIPYTTRYVVDDSLEPGQTQVQVAGVEGAKTVTYRVTYVDGQAQERTQTGESVTKTALDEVIAVGPEKQAEPEDTPSAETSDEPSTEASDEPTEEPSEEATQPAQDEQTDEPTAEPTTAAPEPTETATPTPTPTQTQTQQPTQTPTPTQTAKPTPTPTQTQQPTPTPTQQPVTKPDAAATSRLYHPTPAAAQAYAAGAAAQYGWTGQNWTDLVKLWNRESGWSWNAENPWSGAYGIPQSLPGDKMAAFGANWRDDAAVQIDWGLSYIAGRYGTPSKAWEHSEKAGWY